LSEPVYVGSEPLPIQRLRRREGGDRHRSRDEALPADRMQLTDRDPIACHDERFPSIKLAHDLAALVPKTPVG
jgi:hypothetical protein